MGFCKVDEIPYDQKVIYIAHASDGSKFVIQTRTECSVIIRVAHREPFAAEMIQISPGIVPGGHFKSRELCDSELNLHVAALSDPVCILDSLRSIGKESAHLLLGLYIVLSALIAHPVFIGDLLSRLDTEQDVMSLPVLSVDIMAVICRHERDVQFF